MSISALLTAFGNLDRLQALQKTLLANGYLGTACAVLGGAVVLRKAHGILTQAAVNNFSCDSYDWRREVVVVTGGSGGLGDLLVRKLAKDCIKVISLDIVPPRTPLRKF
jgi:hypothetical protein